MKKYFQPCVYTLSDPLTNEIRYVGSTTTRMCNKLAVHKADTKRCSHPTSDWIKSLLQEGLKPVIEVLEYCDADERLDLEKFYITYLHSLGLKLLNITYIKKANRAKTLSKEHIEKLSIAHTGSINIKKRKKIGQYTLQGEFIREWTGVIAAQNEFGCKSISVTIKKHGRAGGYLWKYI